jgi:hypothetical protein
VTTEKCYDKVAIVWLPKDILAIRPDWSDEQCADALHYVRRELKDRSIEYGWEVLEHLLDERGCAHLIRRGQ